MLDHIIPYKVLLELLEVKNVWKAVKISENWTISPRVIFLSVVSLQMPSNGVTCFWGSK